MANGTKKSFASGYGYGWDKEIYNPYGAGGNQELPIMLQGQGTNNFLGIDLANLGNVSNDNSWVNPGGEDMITLPKVGLQTLPVDMRNTTGMTLPPGYMTGANVGGTYVGTRAGDPEYLGAPSVGGGVDAGGGGFGKRFAANMKSPQAMAGMASGIGGIIQGLAGRGKRRDAQIAAQGDYDKMRQQYLGLDTSNIYAGVENMYANLENPYEDLTVNKQQAEFEAQQAARSRANIMANLQSAAGASGIAGLAQAMANQGQIQAQQAAGSIGLQESRNIYAKAQGAIKIQQMERQGADMAQRMRLAGEETARSLDWQKTGTLFGMAQQDLAAANQAIAASDAALYGGIGQVAGTLGMMALSDRKLKKNINLVGKSPSGLNIYNFEYINSKYGDGIYQGVMSDEIPSRAIIDNNGYDIVDYSMIDVEFKRIN